MATADNDPISLECKLCEKNYQYKDGPVSLPCLHAFCKPCLVRYIEKEETLDKKMACPTCNSRFPVPEDINSLPLNLRLSHLAKNSSYKNKMEGENVSCQKCEEDDVKNATVFCCNCCEFLCKKCKHYHQMFLRDEAHEFIELDKFDKAELKIHPPPSKCTLHHEKLALFCESCEELICLFCAQITHKDHEQNYLDKTSMKESIELKEMADNVGGPLGELNHAIQEIQDMKEKISISAKDASNKIDRAFKEIIKAVEQRKENVQIKCREIAQEKLDVLSNQLNEFERLHDNLRYAQLHATDASNNGTPEELLSMKKVIKQRIKRMTETYENQSMELREDDTINTCLEIEPLLEQIVAFRYFPGVPDASKCTIEGLSVPMAAIGKERKMVVASKDEKNDPVPGHVYLQYQLKKKDADPDEYIPPKLTITQSNEGQGRAVLGFTPDGPGEYEVTLMVRNKPLRPHTIIARHPRDYSKFSSANVSYKAGLASCWGVAVHTDGAMYVTSCSQNTLTLVAPDGSQQQIGNSNNEGGSLSTPRGLMILEDSLYVACQGNHTIAKYSIEDGKFLKSFGAGGNGKGQFNGPYGICTDGKGRLLVAEYSNNRIQILTADGEHVSFIGCSHQPWDVAVDPEGIVHVALYNNNHIAMYTQEGQALGTYNLDGNLQYPSGIYIDGEGNKLISALSNSQVHIADANNKLISTRSIAGVYTSTMDNNGTVLMADYTNSRIVVVDNN